MILKDKKVTVMGLGGFGGGAAVTRYLVSKGARVTVTDMRDGKELLKSIESLNGLDVRFKLGGHDDEDFTEADIVIVNPAVPPHSKFLDIARKAGVALDTEMNLFFKLCRAPILGVTGSNGKSTTTALAAAMLENSGRAVRLGGNLGRSLLEEAESIAPDECVVLELSSFQLERLAWIGRAPDVGVILNLTPNHLDWHGTMKAYANAKKNMLRFQGAGDAIVLNREDPEVSSWEAEARGRVYGYSEAAFNGNGGWLEDDAIIISTDGRDERIGLDGFKLPGMHNRLNATAAATGATLMGATPDGIKAALQSFTALPHRLEFVAEVKGVRYYNDSVATTPESTITALRSFNAPKILIAGGYDKKLPFDRMAAEAASAKIVILIGASADKIEDALAKISAPVKRIRAGEFEEAVRRAANSAEPGDVVLLSPGCASYDMFRNFEQRGEIFRKLVKELSDEYGSTAQ